MKAVLIDHFRRYTLAYMAAFGYATLASLGAFIDIFSNLTRDQAHAMPWWAITALAAKCVTPGVAAILAFVNQSLSKVQPSTTQPPFPTK